MKKYYNNITKLHTEYKYRFKTKQEFEYEFGDWWYDDIVAGWNYEEEYNCMNHLFGLDLKINIIDEHGDESYFLYKLKNASIYYHDDISNNTWRLSQDMVKENDKLNYNAPRQLLYEKFDNKYKKIVCKFNNEEEFIDIQKTLNDNGIFWGGWDYPKYIEHDGHFDIVNIFIIFKISNNYFFSYRDYESNNEMMEYLTFDCDESEILILDFNELKKLIIKKPDYNTPRQLVYEKFKYEEYDTISIEIHSEDESIKVQNFLFDKGYKWFGDNSPILFDNDDIGHIFIDKNKKITYLPINYQDGTYIESKYGDNPKYIGVNNLTELKKLFIIDYNTTRQLVYEGLNINDYNFIIYSCSDISDVKNVVKLALDNGYVFFLDEDGEFDYFDSYKYILFDVNEKDMMVDNDIADYSRFYGSLHNGIKEIYGEDSIYIDSFRKLQNLFGVKKPDYNTSRQLVYESKIISKYRFKTEKEFIDEYGENWLWKDIHWNKSNEMDYLFGQQIEDKYIINFLDKNGELKMEPQDRFRYDDWTINYKMITRTVKKIDYNKPRQLVYERKIIKFNEHKKGE